MGDSEDLYREFVLDHYGNPRNFGIMDEPDISHEGKNPLCGDRIRIDLKVKDGVIEEILFSGEGCVVSMASASILTELVKGKTLEEVRRIKKDDLLKAIGANVGPSRMKCAMLPLQTLKIGAYGLESWQEEEDEDF